MYAHTVVTRRRASKLRFLVKRQYGVLPTYWSPVILWAFALLPREDLRETNAILGLYQGSIKALFYYGSIKALLRL
jgi:hypothetical protein